MTDLDENIEVVAAPHFETAERYLNRELSWLDFNERVLALVEDNDRPLLERVKFAAIFSTNLDEFFQVRVAGLREQVRAGATGPSADGMTPTQQLDAIGERVRELSERLVRSFLVDIAPALEKEAIRFVGWDDVGPEDRNWLGAYFDDHLFPVLTPLAVDPAHPFPYISNLSLNLAVVISDPTEHELRFARVKVPPSLPRFVALPDGEGFLPLEELIAARLDALFPGMTVHSHHPFRVTRNADFEVEEDEADDLLEAIETGLRRRRRTPHVVRLEVGVGMNEEVLELLEDELEIDPSQVFASAGPLDLGGLWPVYALDRPELKDHAWTPKTQPRLANLRRPRSLLPHNGSDHSTTVDTRDIELGPSIFDVIRQGDILVHHPYDSFATSVEAFIEHAAADPDVLAIKWTLYRTSGPKSAIIRNLILAAETGKQVVALVELKARFDEAANIAWARALEEAGVHVVYGLVGLKTHAKIALIVRAEGDTLVRYTHIGTGNYNPNTATTYEDVGILSCDPDLGADSSDLFNLLTGYSRQRAFRKISVAPLGMRERVIDLIGREAGRPEGYIEMKMNSLADPEVIDALYRASQRGTRVDLVVRGVCCLRPGVPGLSENIRVRSLVGRFLEHSRIYRFGNNVTTADYLIGSADMMGRNLDRRIEALIPVEDPKLKQRLAEILEVEHADDTLAWDLGADGSWTRVAGTTGSNTHETLQALAEARSRAAHAEDV